MCRRYVYEPPTDLLAYVDDQCGQRCQTNEYDVVTVPMKDRPTVTAHWKEP